MSKQKIHKKSFTCGIVLEEKDYKKLQKIASNAVPTTSVSAIIRMLITNYLKGNTWKQ